MIKNYDFRMASNAKYELPELPYSLNALDGFITSEILEIHHGKHHQSYVDGLNKSIDQLNECRKTGDFTYIKGIERNLAFNYSGHVLHSIYWNSLNPSGLQVSPTTASKIERDFGSFESFKKHFIEAGKAAEGSAWVALVSDPMKDVLYVNVIENHQNMSMVGSNIHTICDVWEHAYYLKYANDRESYLNAFFDVANIA